MNNFYYFDQLVYSNENEHEFFKYCHKFIIKNTKGYTILAENYDKSNVYTIKKNEFGYIMQNKKSTVNLYTIYPELFTYKKPICNWDWDNIEKPTLIKEKIYLEYDERENYDEDYRKFCQDYRTYMKLKDSGYHNHPMFHINYKCMDMLNSVRKLNKDNYMDYIEIMKEYEDKLLAEKEKEKVLIISHN